MSNNNKRLVYVLSDFGSDGVPDNVNYDPNGAANNTDLFKTIDSNLLADINSKLPESIKLPDAHPDWLKDSDLHIVEDNATVEFTFVDEGAGYKNVIAYYVYDTDSPPRTLDDIKVLYVMFPNFSKIGAGGGLTAGDTIRIPSAVSVSSGGKGWVSTPTSYTFNAGQSIGLALFPNAYRSYKNNINRNGLKYYSRSILNPESTPERRFHTVNIRSDYLTDHVIIGFEDLHRDGNTDDDFNDAIMLCKVTPETALDDGNINNENVVNEKGTILCDDMILEAEYCNNDYSDAILEYNGTMTSTSGNIDSIELVFDYRHRSTLFDHEFGIKITNISQYNTTITRETFIGDSSSSTVDNPTVSDDRVPVVDSGKTVLPPSGNSAHYANTHPGWDADGVRTPPSTIKLKIVFNEDVTNEDLGSLGMPFLPYLKVFPSGVAGSGDSYFVDHDVTYKGVNRVTNSVSQIHKIIVLKNVLNYQCSHEHIKMIEAFPEFEEFLTSKRKNKNGWHEITRPQYMNPTVTNISRTFSI